MADERNYWQSRRLNRRRALYGGAIGAGAVALAACGGGNNNSNGGASNSNSGSGGGKSTPVGLLPAASTATPAAAAKTPKPGGSLSYQLPSAPPAFDPYTQTSFLNAVVNSLSYSKLYRFKAGVPSVAPTDPSMELDMAAAMPEIVGDTQITVKLKPGIKFHNVAPTNGRALTSEDVKYAVDRYQNFDKSVFKSYWTFLDSMQTPDPQTIVFKLKYPYADFVSIAGGNLASYISPKEFAETPDAQTKMVGSGPFIHTEYQTGVSVSFKKNPDYYDKPYPYVDDLKLFIVTDQAKRVADFSAKSVDLTYIFLPDERDQLKKSRPDAKFDEQQGISSYLYMRTDKPPFNDKRVRQALSMAIDRKAIQQALTKGEGVNDKCPWVALTGISRQVSELGAAAKYWDYNPMAAKQMLDAAGASNPSFQWTHADAAIYTQPYVDLATLTQAQWKQIGINAMDVQQPYAQYISSTYQGMYEGVGHSPQGAPYFLDYLTDQLYWSSAGQRARINLSYINDPMLNTLLDKQRGQYDAAARKVTIGQIEDLMAEQQYQIYWTTDTRTYFWAPDVQNYRPSGFYPATHFMKAWHDR